MTERERAVARSYARIPPTCVEFAELVAGFALPACAVREIVALHKRHTSLLRDAHIEALMEAASRG